MLVAWLGAEQVKYPYIALVHIHVYTYTRTDVHLNSEHVRSYICTRATSSVRSREEGYFKKKEKREERREKYRHDDGDGC